MVAAAVQTNQPSIDQEGPVKHIRVKEAARYTGLSESEIYRAIYAGALKALRYRDRTWLLTYQDVDAWLAANTASSQA